MAWLLRFNPYESRQVQKEVLTGDFFASWNTIGWIQEITHPTLG